MSPVFVDAMVLRDSDTDNDNATGDYGGISADFDERVYVLNDANFNVTAIVGKVSGTWQVVERFRYDPYGAPTFLDPNWAVDSGGSDYGWVHLHQGGRYDAATKLAHFRWRDLHVELGRWTRQDPATGLVNFQMRDLNTGLGSWVQVDPTGYVDGMNLYQFVTSDPVNGLDPLGLQPARDNGIGAGGVEFQTSPGQGVLRPVHDPTPNRWMSDPGPRYTAPYWEKRVIRGCGIAMVQSSMMLLGSLGGPPGTGAGAVVGGAINGAIDWDAIVNELDSGY
jgi:hypothetical protein